MYQQDEELEKLLPDEWKIKCLIRSRNGIWDCCLVSTANDYQEQAFGGGLTPTEAILDAIKAIQEDPYD